MTIDYFNVRRADALMAATGCDGCAEHGDPSCLCDVVVESETPITNVPPLLFNFDGKDDFVRLAELMLGKQELVDVERIQRSMGDRGVVVIPDPEQIEWLWATHWDSGVTAAEAGEAMGFTKAHTLRLAKALGLPWISRNKSRGQSSHPGRQRYLELREGGATRAEAIAAIQAEWPTRRLSESTASKWWWAHRQAVAA